MVAWPYRLLALAALGIALFGLGWLKGANHVQAQWYAATAAQQQAQAQVQIQQAEATVQVVREKGDTIIQEVPVYVPVQADAACTVHHGFVSLHDAAAAGDLPEPTRDPDAPAEGLALSSVATTVVANYQTCYVNAEQLKALQDWIRQTR